MSRSALTPTSFAQLRSVPRRVLTLTAVASAAVVGFGVIQGWPVWAIVSAGLAPWVPVVGVEIGWTGRHYGWLALFYVLVVTQGGHVVEHIVQVTQIHVVGTPPKQARGVFGALDIEWVHFVWNTWVLVAVVLLVLRFRRNPWLWATLAFAVWHEAEHAYLITKYIATGIPGHPGLGAKGGAFGGGLPITRPDLHFYYNIIETAPLIAGFVYQVRRTYDAWLSRAFPRLAPDALRSATAASRPRRYAGGDEIVREGDLPRSCFVIANGDVEVSSAGPVGTRAVVLGPGQVFGEVGLLRSVPRTATVRARTAVDVLELDAQTFQDIVEGSPETAAELERVARERSTEV
jgi:hypothetical protein